MSLDLEGGKGWILAGQCIVLSATSVNHLKKKSEIVYVLVAGCMLVAAQVLS